MEYWGDFPPVHVQLRRLFRKAPTGGPAPFKSRPGAIDADFMKMVAPVRSFDSLPKALQERILADVHN